MATRRYSDADKLRVLRQKCQTDLFFLATEILGLEFDAKVHKPLFEFFVQKKPGVPLDEQDTVKNRLLLWPRGSFKTTADVVDIVQWLLVDPNVRIFIVSGTLTLAKRMLEEVRNHFRNEKLLAAFPEYRFTDKEAGTGAEFTVKARTKFFREPSVGITSADAVGAGTHMDILKFDDLVHDGNVGTVEQIRKSIDVLAAFQPRLEPGGYRDIVGTRYVDGDAYGDVIDKRRWKRKNCKFGFDAESDDGLWKLSLRKAWVERKGEQGEKLYEFVFPEMRRRDGSGKKGYNLAYLKEQERENTYKFSCQYLNNPVHPDEALFSEEMILACCVTPQQVPPSAGTFIVWDFGGVAQHKGNDYTVAVVGRYDREGRLYIIDLLRGRFNPSELVSHIFNFANKWRPWQVGIEEAQGARLLLPSLEAYHRETGFNLPLDWLKVPNTKNAKAERIAALRPLIENKKVFFLNGLPDFEQLLAEFTKFPRGRHDDIPDAISRLLEYRGSVEVVSAYLQDRFEQVSEFTPTDSSDDGFGGVGGVLIG